MLLVLIFLLFNFFILVQASETKPAEINPFNYINPLESRSYKALSNSENKNKAESKYIGKTFSLDRKSYRSSGKVFFKDEKSIILKEFNISNPPDAFVYLGYGGSASDYVKRGKIISPLLKNKRNATLNLKLKEELKDSPYTHLAIICRKFNFMINPGFKFKK